MMFGIFCLTQHLGPYTTYAELVVTGMLAAQSLSLPRAKLSWPHLHMCTHSSLAPMSNNFQLPTKRRGGTQDETALVRPDASTRLAGSHLLRNFK